LGHASIILDSLALAPRPPASDLHCSAPPHSPASPPPRNRRRPWARSWPARRRVDRSKPSWPGLSRDHVPATRGAWRQRMHPRRSSARTTVWTSTRSAPGVRRRRAAPCYASASGRP